MKRVGLIYEPTLTQHYVPDEKEHVEQPARITSIYRAILEVGLLNQLIPVRGRVVTDSEVLLVHENSFYQKLVKNFRTNRYFGSSDMYANESTFECVKLAAGSTLNLVEEIASGRLDSGMALVRPPGHHACSNQVSGFCFLNNVMIAAADMSIRLGKKVLVVDWDVHLGNGSIDIMKTTMRKNDNLRFFSIHRYDSGSFYPGGKVGKTGLDLDGKIFKIGFDLRLEDPDDEFYTEQFQERMVPWAKEFNPDLIIVSCGFDAAIGDPLGGCSVTPTGYFQLTEILKTICPRIALILEGGYNLNSISRSSVACLQSLLE